MALYKCLHAVPRLRRWLQTGRAIRPDARSRLPLRGDSFAHDAAQYAAREISQPPVLAAPNAILHGIQTGRDCGPADNLAAPYGASAVRRDTA